MLKEESHKNIQSEKGILNRQIRSIQTEGCFGDMKENNDFRRFNYRSSKKVYKELMLYMFGKNIGKYHKFIHDEIQKFEGKTVSV
ncbi:MAG: transposase [Acidaminobacteraceae bacterium]